jgi:crossover junction endodeoxyribonuclease RuvC
MNILGIDPGTAIVGWGVIHVEKNKINSIGYGTIEPEVHDDSGRLIEIHTDLQKILNEYKPDAVSIEELFFATNAKTAISVGQARGVIVLTCALSHIPIFSYTPLVVKRTVCGDGSADKKQVGKMITLTLQLPEIPKPDDTSDALAIALTHAYNYKMKAII